MSGRRVAIVRDGVESQLWSTDGMGQKGSI